MEVYFDGGFFRPGSGQFPCKKTGVTREFQWDGHIWRILALYACEKGLVLDLAKEVPAEEIRSFDEKWLGRIRDQENGLSDFPEENMEFENPFAEQMQMCAWINGAEVESISGYRCVYRPKGCRGEANPAAGSAAEEVHEAQEEGMEIAVEADSGAKLAEYYGLSQGRGWYFERKILKQPFRKGTTPNQGVFEEGVEAADLSGTRDGKGNLRLELKPEKLQIRCKHTFETKPGETGRQIAFSHPIAGSNHVLQIEDVTRERLSEQLLTIGEKEYRIPTHLQCLHYSFLNPEDSNRFTVRDLAQGDQPVCVNETLQEQGATSIFLCGSMRRQKGEEPGKESCKLQASRVCFQPVENVRWGIMAMVERGEALTLELEWPKAETEQE